MEMVKQLGVVEGKVEDVPDMSDLELGRPPILVIDPATCDAKEAARIAIEDSESGRRIVVIGSAGSNDLTRLLIEQLRDEDRSPWQVETVWPNNRTRRVGIVGGLMHMALHYLSTPQGPGGMSYNPYQEDYFNYRQRLREEEVARGMRRPPKKAICSSRRRGRKFKG